MLVEAAQGDITEFDVDAIVNAANTALRRGSGVCGAIFAAAGPELDAACAAIGRCETGDAVATPGFNLRARWIIHTVGPVWKGGMSDEATLLASCYRNSMRLAAAHGIRSIAFPAISCGAFGYPVDEAVAIAVREVRAWDEAQPARIVFCCFGNAMAARYRRALSCEDA